jgi:hypothetical protein
MIDSCLRIVSSVVTIPSSSIERSLMGSPWVGEPLEKLHSAMDYFREERICLSG